MRKTLDPGSAFEAENTHDIEQQGKDSSLSQHSLEWMLKTAPYKYTYHFTWMGRPIIQFPQDIMAMQELIFLIKPTLIVETGIAHGGSLIFNASMLELIGGEGQVLGIDIDIREHNRVEIEKHPMFKRIEMIEGSSISTEVAERVHDIAKGKDRILVILDSNHTHDHVLREMELYSPLVKKGSYMIVFDTALQDVPDEFSKDRPWGKDNNPKTAVWEFMKSNDRFEIDKEIENKLLITVAPDGYLKCVKD